MPPPNTQPIVTVPAACTNCGTPASKLRIYGGTWHCPVCSVSGTPVPGAY